MMKVLFHEGIKSGEGFAEDMQVEYYVKIIISEWIRETYNSGFH